MYFISFELKLKKSERTPRLIVKVKEEIIWFGISESPYANMIYFYTYLIFYNYRII